MLARPAAAITEGTETPANIITLATPAEMVAYLLARQKKSRVNELHLSGFTRLLS